MGKFLHLWLESVVGRRVDLVNAIDELLVPADEVAVSIEVAARHHLFRWS